MDRSDDSKEDRLQDRIRGGRPMLWFLVDGNRAAVALLMLGAVYVLLIVLGEFAPGSIRNIFDRASVAGLFTPLVIAIVMGVSIVLTFNQMILSRELGPLGEQRERMSEALTFREDAEEAVEGGTSPPEPSLFLRGLVDATREPANRLVEAVSGVEESVRTDVTEYGEDVLEDAERVSAALEGEQFGGFAVVREALNFNYSWKIYAGRRLRNDHRDALPPEAREALDDLLSVLEFFGPAREHFKTLYFRWEIINVSRALVYTALPALVVAAYMLLVFEPDPIAGTTAGLNHSLLFIGVAFAVCATPFVIFLAYILRVVTVAKWTLAIGPFILRETQRGSDLDWE
ncbi:hypothetical protein [Halalkalicoccus sp. NIPERK01]|uniref:hypothetical protein n=1 Tax=Halalkalicoccus sp. NIPERK01 TaxID=3053469 RepID=UPI00256EE85A|nr:hypothetical protein [Halalkalicoccus sp. NIPERK01]MDL5362679.1 hypothetical protein [Halalkalicoccus sp. NIPERK01]